LFLRRKGKKINEKIKPKKSIHPIMNMFNLLYQLKKEGKVGKIERGAYCREE